VNHENSIGEIKSVEFIHLGRRREDPSTCPQQSTTTSSRER